MYVNMYGVTLSCAELSWC